MFCFVLFTEGMVVKGVYGMRMGGETPPLNPLFAKPNKEDTTRESIKRTSNELLKI